MMVMCAAAVLDSRCGSKRITWRQNRAVVGRLERSASTASVASFRCRGRSGTASRRRTASRTGRGRCYATGTYATRTRPREINATCQPPPDCRQHKSATGLRTDVNETEPPNSSTGTSLNNNNNNN